MLIYDYASHTNKKSYWSKDKNLFCAMVSYAIRRDRFELIFRYSADHKTWKLRPLANALKIKFLERFKLEPDLSDDESMVEYYGCHGWK